MPKSLAWIALAAVAALSAVSCATSVDSPPPDDSETCAAHETDCSEACVDTNTDPANCGECGNACASGKCTEGVCNSACAMPLSECNGTCVDLQNDSANCGVCGISCGAPLVCSGGMCGPPCEAGKKACDGMCVDVQTDHENCGMCGNACIMEATCTSGQCQNVCNLGLTYCSGTCADLQTDAAHCGSCINACKFDETCEAGVCTAICTAPEAYCSGACVDKKTDEANCGSCGVVCTTGQLCNNGLCQCQGGVCGSCGVTDLGNVSPQTVTGTTLGGTDVLTGDCTFGGSPEAVYSFTAAVDGNYKFDTTGSSFDAAVYVLSTACLELKCSADFDAKVSLNLLANETVYVVVDGAFSSAGNYVLGITSGPPIPCPNLTISGVPFTETGDTSTLPDNLINGCGGDNSPDNTYSFTAPTTGTYEFDTFGSTFDTTLAVLDGSCSGAELTCDDDTNGSQSQVFVTLTAGQTVVLVVDGFSSDQGPYTLHGALSTCPEADLGGAVPQTVTGTTVGATSASSSLCAGENTPEYSYTFTAPAPGLYTFDTFGSAFNTVLYVRDASCSGPELTCNDDSGGPQSQVGLALTANQTVVVTVDGLNGATGNYTLNVGTGVCPAQDLGSTVPQSLSGTTAGKPNYLEGTCASPGGTEMTYSFTAPTTKSYTIDTLGSSIDTILYVRDGTCTGIELACDDDTINLDSQVIVNLTAGQTVVIVVDGYDPGAYMLHIQ